MERIAALVVLMTGLCLLVASLFIPDAATNGEAILMGGALTIWGGAWTSGLSDERRC